MWRRVSASRAPMGISRKRLKSAVVAALAGARHQTGPTCQESARSHADGKARHTGRALGWRRISRYAQEIAFLRCTNMRPAKHSNMWLSCLILLQRLAE